MAKSARVASPTSTAGEGFTFERAVAACYLGAVLTRQTPRGMDYGTAVKVSFQRRWDERYLDDLIVDVDGRRGIGTLSLQVKLDVKFGENETFSRVIGDAWRDFQCRRFQTDRDRLGLILQAPTTRSAAEYARINRWARGSTSSDEFFDRIKASHLSNRENRYFVKLVSDLISKVEPQRVDLDSLYQFFRSFVILHFDVQRDVTGEDCSSTYAALSRFISGVNSRDVFLRLEALAADTAAVAGSIDFDRLKCELAKDWSLDLPANEPSPSRHNLPYRRNRFFFGSASGRESLLRDLIMRFHTAAGSCLRIEALKGAGGFGKTQIALEYAYRHIDKYGVVLWVRSETTADLQNDFVAIARLLGLQERSARQVEVVVSAVLRWLETRKNWLLIFDNADSPELIRPFLPRDGAGHILITSRANNLDALQVTHALEVGEMEPDEAAGFLLNRVYSDSKTVSADERRSAKELVEELGYLPLALEQAGACIKAVEMRIRQYRELYRKKHLQLFRDHLPRDYPKSVLSTWILNFRHVEQELPEAADLLRIVSLTNPDNVPVDLIIAGRAEFGKRMAKALAPCHDDALKLARLLEPLKRFSLIRWNRHRSTFRIHRLIQEAVRACSMNREALREWSLRVVRALIAGYPVVEPSGTDTVSHFKGAIALLHTLPKGRQRDAVEAEARAILGPVLIRTSGYASDEVGRNYEAALVLCSRRNHTKAFQVLWGLWVHSYVRGELAPSLKRAERLLIRAQHARNQGEQVEAHRALGSTYYSLGQFDSAQKHLDSGCRLYNPVRDRLHAAGYAVNPLVVCRGYGAVSMLLREGEARGRDALKLLERTSRSQRLPFCKVFGNYWVAVAYQLLGDNRRALQAAEQVIYAARDGHFPQWEAMGMILRGWARSGKDGQGADEIRDGLERHARTGACVFRPYFFTLLAEASLLEGQLQSATDAIQEAHKVSRATKEHAWTVETLRVEGDICRMREGSGLARAERAYRKAIALAGDQKARALHVRAAVSLIDLLLATRRDEEARVVWSCLRSGHWNCALAIDIRKLPDGWQPSHGKK